MTVKELMDITGKSRDAIIDRVKKLFPDITFEPRKKVVLTGDQAQAVLESYHPGFDLSGNAIEEPDRPAEKTVRIIHEKRGPGAVTDLLKQLGKYLSKEEMHDFIMRNEQILAPQEPRQLEEHGKSEESGEA